MVNLRVVRPVRLVPVREHLDDRGPFVPAREPPDLLHPFRCGAPDRDRARDRVLPPFPLAGDQARVRGGAPVHPVVDAVRQRKRASNQFSNPFMKSYSEYWELKRDVRVGCGP